jgi:hypothetical protein
MASGFISTVFNFVGFAHFAFALYYQFTVITPLDLKLRGFEFGGPFIYITILASVSEKPLNFSVFIFGNSYQCQIIPRSFE